VASAGVQIAVDAAKTAPASLRETNVMSLSFLRKIPFPS
jgi:hypothetical protein